jgi:tetratricopeptide (TPR) repeat protein
MPDPLPSIVDQYQHVTVLSSRPSMMDTGVYLEKGDTYSIFADGTITIGRGRVGPYTRLWAIIGSSPIFKPVPTVQNTGLLTAKYSGELKLGVLDGGFDDNGNALLPDRYRDNAGAFSVDIIVWKENDLNRIEEFLVQLEEKTPKREMVRNLRIEISRSRCVEAIQIVHKGLIDANREKTIALLTKAIGYCPGYVEAYDKVGAHLFEIGEMQSAKTYLKKAEDLGTKDPKTFYLLADISFQENDINEAFRLINESLGLDGSFGEALELKKRIEVAANMDGPKLILYEPVQKRGIVMLEKRDVVPVRGIAIDKDGLSWVTVNGKSVPTDRYGNFETHIPVELGANTLLIKAMDGIGNRSELRVTLEGKIPVLPKVSTIRSKADMASLYDRSHAVVIGIDRYRKWPFLEFAVADARAVAKQFEETRFDRVVSILNEDATRARILTTLFRDLPQTVGPNDRIVFYFAGHGQTEDLEDGQKRGYIIPYDAEVDDYTKTAISMDLIKRLSSDIQAKHILYVMDCCYSGLGLSRSAGISPTVSDYIRKMSAMRAVQIITAGGKGEQVREAAGHGLFTSYFLKALAGEADYNKDNIVTGTELGAYLRPVVSNASNQAQTPLYGRLEGEGEFLFYVGGRRD